MAPDTPKPSNDAAATLEAQGVLPVETHPETPDITLENLNQVPGSRLCAMLGIERDLQMKPLPSGTTVIDVSLETCKNPTAVLQRLKEIIEQFGGAILPPLWTGVKKLRLQAILPNIDQTYAAAYEIKLSHPQAKISASPDPCGIMTYKGNLISVGRGFEDASEVSAFAQPNQNTLTVKQNMIMEDKQLNPVALESLVGFQDNSTPQSKQHADRLQPIDPNLPNKGALIKIKIQQRDYGSDLIEETKDLIRIIDAAKGEKTIISSQGLQATIFVAEERIGETVSRLGSIQNLLQKTSAAICIDVADDCRFVSASTKTYLFQSQRVPVVNEIHAKGIWGTSDKFAKEIRHERNRANVRMTLGQTAEKFVKIEKIEPVYFEAAVGGPRKTIGREKELQKIHGDLENLKRRGRANITVLTGEAGVGKTRLAAEANAKAHELNVASVYYKTPEDGKNTPGSGVKKLIEGILKTKPELLDNFRDLRFFTLGRVPEEFEEKYGPAVAALSTKEFLSRRFCELMEECEKQPLQIILDDLQWFDAVSVEIIKTWMARVDEQSNIQIMLLAREGEERLPEDFEKILAKKQGFTSRISLNRLNYRQNPEFLEDYIRYSLPENWEHAAIPESFVQEIAEVSQGLPFVITEILSLLVEKGDIKLRNGTVVVRSNAVRELAQENVSVTLSSVLQARFERLTIDEKRTADYLVALGNVSYEIFVNLLRYLGENPSAVEKSLVSLRKKGILKFEPFGFSHDLLRRERESQMEGHDAKLSCVAASCYPVLKQVAPKYPQVITPVFLFELLMKASKQPEALTDDQRKTVSGNLMPCLCSASDFAIDKNENMLASEVVKRFFGRIDQNLNSALDRILERKDPQTIAGLAPDLFKALCNAAEAHVRMGQPARAIAFLNAIDHLADRVPNAQLRTGLAGLQYFQLQANAAYAARNRERFTHAKGEFENAAQLAGAPNDPRVRLAKCEAALMNIRLCADIQQACRAAVDAKSELYKLTKEAEQRNDRKLTTASQALSMDITRTIQQKMFKLLTERIKGVDDEALFMQEIRGDAVLELNKLKEQFTQMKKNYEDNPGLVRDPQAYGYLFDMLARIQHLLGLADDADATVEAGIRTCTNMNLMEIVSRLHKLKGDILTASAIPTWNTETLERAIDEYTQGIAEIERVIEDKKTKASKGEEVLPSDDKLYKTLNALNRGWAFSLLTLAKTSKGRFEQLEATEEFSVLGQRLNTEWISMCTAVAERKTNLGQNIDPSTEQDYLKELAHAGLLIEASLDPRLGITLPAPQHIELKDIRAEMDFLERQRAQIKLRPGNYSGADKALVALRWKGINAWKHIFPQLGAVDSSI